MDCKYLARSYSTQFRNIIICYTNVTCCSLDDISVVSDDETSCYMARVTKWWSVFRANQPSCGLFHLQLRTSCLVMFVGQVCWRSFFRYRKHLCKTCLKGMFLKMKLFFVIQMIQRTNTTFIWFGLSSEWLNSISGTFPVLLFHSNGPRFFYISGKLCSWQRDGSWHLHLHHIGSTAGIAGVFVRAVSKQ